MWALIYSLLPEVFSLVSILIMTFGVALGILFGAMPGLSAAMGVALLIPITFGMTAAHGLTLLGSIYIGAIYGGSISAILIRVPGTPASIATIFDGYKMTENGEADKALKISITSSFVGGLLSAIALLLISPLLARIALSFGPAEYFWVAIFGLSIIVSLCTDNPIKGLLSAGFGLFIGVIGMDPIIATERFTFGYIGLLNGVPIVVMLIGLFSIPQALEMIEGKELNKAPFLMKRKKVIGIMELLREIKQIWVTYIRSSIIGIIIGIIPGAGANIASYMGYNEAKRWSKNSKKFGTGISEGVAASEAANNAVTGGSLIPLLTLGVPGNQVSAVLVGGLMIHGLQPGPMLFVKNPEVVYTFILAFMVANVIMLFLGYYGANLFVNVVKMPKSILAPIIIVLSMIGSYALANSFFDVMLMLMFGIIGYFMRKVNISSAPAVLALILGPMAEANIRRVILMSGGGYTKLFDGFLNWVLILLTFMSLAFAFYIFFKNRAEKKEKIN